MQASSIIEILKDSGKQWNVDGELVDPDEDSLERVLDEMARMLYAEDIGTRITVAGFIMEKRPLGHDVYVYAGNFE